MFRRLLPTLLCLTAVSAYAQFPVNRRPLTRIAAEFNGYDINRDGTVEISSIVPLAFDAPPPPGKGNRGLALILVEPRLLESTDEALSSSLKRALQQHRDDLVHEDWTVSVMQLDAYRGPLHQDGLTVLALRRFLRAVYGEYPLKGVTLVGSFPEASLVRRALFRGTDPEGKDYLQLMPERVNPRAELILADMDGGWESLYQRTFDLDSFVFDIPAATPTLHDGQTIHGRFTTYERVEGEDVFFLRDDFVDIVNVGHPGSDDSAVRVAYAAQRNPELTAADAQQPNPNARPEILVSRIDAHGIAFNPVGPRDIYGNTPLDGHGRPQALVYEAGPIGFPRDPAPPQPDAPPTIFEAGFEWARDPLLEQRILLSYFDRNHQHRNGVGHALQHRVGVIRQLNSGLDDAGGYAADILNPADPAAFSPAIAIENARLLDYAKFLTRTPAVLRGVLAHSTGRSSAFYDNASGVPDATAGAALDTLIGGNAWAWQASAHGDSTLHKTPSAIAFREEAAWSFGRTLWENNTLMYSGFSFFVHSGCSVNVPDGNFTTRHDELAYGYKNNADSILMFQNGLAALVRGKVFNDAPQGAGDAIALAGGQFGEAWRGYSLLESSRAERRPGSNGDERVLHNKQAYYWSLRGDWSLNLRYP